MTKRCKKKGARYKVYGVRNDLRYMVHGMLGLEVWGHTPYTVHLVPFSYLVTCWLWKPKKLWLVIWIGHLITISLNDHRFHMDWYASVKGRDQVTLFPAFCYLGWHWKPTTWDLLMASVLAVYINTIETASMRQNYRKSVIHPIKYSIIHELDMTAGNRFKGNPDSLGGSCDDARKKD